MNRVARITGRLTEVVQGVRKLFRAFQRLHQEHDLEKMGVGLPIVRCSEGDFFVDFV